MCFWQLFVIASGCVHPRRRRRDLNAIGKYGGLEKLFDVLVVALTNGYSHLTCCSILEVYLQLSSAMLADDLYALDTFYRTFPLVTMLGGKRS